MVKLDPNAGQDTEAHEVDFEQELPPDEAEVTGEATQQSEPVNEGPTEPSEQEQADLEAAGVNTDEVNETKARKREHKLLMKDLKEYGTLYGGGKTSMINLAERVVESAMKKAISPADAGNVYDTFKKAAEAKATMDTGDVIPDAAAEENAPIATNEESYKAQVRKIEDFIALGNTFDDSEDGASDLIRRARNIHIKLLEGNRETVKKGSTYTILTGIAAAHVGRQAKRKVSQGPMTDDEIHKHLWVEPKPENQPADEWSKVEQALAAANSAQRGGRGENPRPAITADTLAGKHLQEAIESLRQCLGEGAPERLQKMEAAEAEAQRLKDQAAADKAAKKASKKKAA